MRRFVLVLIFVSLVVSASEAQAPGYGFQTPAGVVVQDEGVAQGRARTVNFVGSSVTAAVSAGVATVTVTGGAPGGANVVEVSLDLGTTGGLYYATTVTGQAWVTASSVIVCSPFGTTADGQTVETVAVSGVQPTVGNRVAGVGFDVAVYSPHGAAGTYRIHCMGA